MKSLPQTLLMNDIPVKTFSLDTLIDKHKHSPQDECPLVSEGHGAHHGDDHQEDGHGGHHDEVHHDNAHDDSNDHGDGHHGGDHNKHDDKHQDQERKYDEDDHMKDEWHPCSFTAMGPTTISGFWRSGLAQDSGLDLPRVCASPL